MKITDKIKKESLRLTEENNKLRWFCVNSNFECSNFILKKGWYEKVGSGLTTNGKCIHDIKLRDTKDYFTISDFDYKKIINKFKDCNTHIVNNIPQIV